MPTTIPIEVYEILEDKLGREQAHAITKALENAGASIALQKKAEIRDELSKELASKADLMVTKAELREVISRLDNKVKLYFVITIAVIIITNPRALDMIGKLLGLVK